MIMDGRKAEGRPEYTANQDYNCLYCVTIVFLPINILPNFTKYLDTTFAYLWRSLTQAWRFWCCRGPENYGV